MKFNLPTRQSPHFQRRGFALVIVLSLMILLTLLAVGLLTLSSVALRASGQGAARAEARANARMALMLALGELQKSMGPDQGISARASSVIKNPAEPNLLGTWASWHWQPGRGTPDYAEKTTRFRRWLVSTLDPAEAIRNEIKTTDPVWLVKPVAAGGRATAGKVGPEIRADRVPVRSAKAISGSLAWAVMDESLKAPIQMPEVMPRDDGGRLARRVAPGRARPEMILPALSPTKLGDPAKILSLGTAVVAVGKEAGSTIPNLQGDVTPYSVGLLANVVDGGLKTDLTTLFESTAVPTYPNDQPTLYFTATDGAPRWDYLRSHYQLNRRITAAASGAPVIKLGTTELRPAASGVTVSSASERLLPVIAKLQIMFSAVSHYNHLGDRIDFYETKGNPRGNRNYGCPHLAYDPVITLYNPYDVALDLAKLRVRIWDPPVRFGFKKNAAWLRDEFASGDFHPMARFAIAEESNVGARRYFTLLLTEMTGSRPGGRIRLEPGEVKVFSPWVEPNWTWGVETSGGYTVRCFFDWNVANDFGNRDGRTGNLMGIETVPGWDPRAGLQTDHLSYAGKRPIATRYDFEIANNWSGGWLAIKLADTFTVEAKAGRAVNIASQADFTVDLLAGAMQNPAGDILRTYRFRYADPTKEISANPSHPVIRRTFRVGDILQKPEDKSVGGKSPFAILTMAAKTTHGDLDNSMPWVHNHPVIEGSDQNTAQVGNALDSYDLRFEEVADFNQNPGGIEFDSTTKRGYYGATSFSNGGVSNVPMFRVPLLPTASLGELIPANLVVSSNLPRVTHAFGNSWAHPLIPSAAVSAASPARAAGRMLDHSYLLNDALWDSTYFSTAAEFTNPLLTASPKRGALLDGFFKGTAKLLNPRFIPMLSGTGTPEQQAERLDLLDDTRFSRELAGSLAIQGPFNVNSDSIEAWKAMLGSLRDADLRGWGMADLAPKNKTGFPRAGLPLAGDVENPAAKAGIDLAGQVRWAGFRALNNTQIALLAEKIVEQIRARGVVDQAPSLSLAEFVNRRVAAPGGLHTLAGLLQTAIEKSALNAPFHALDSVDLAAVPVANPEALNGLANPEARLGMSAEGAPPMLTQGDLLMALAPVITVRGDTFRIRAYGESKTPEGKVTATAMCEAVIQRLPAYLDPSEKASLKTAELKQPANLRFGRRFAVTSFRWLSPDEA